jgi:hypothetical protein
MVLHTPRPHTLLPSRPGLSSLPRHISPLSRLYQLRPAYTTSLGSTVSHIRRRRHLGACQTLLQFKTKPRATVRTMGLRRCELQEASTEIHGCPHTAARPLGSTHRLHMQLQQQYQSDIWHGSKSLPALWPSDPTSRGCPVPRFSDAASVGA